VEQIEQSQEYRTRLVDSLYVSLLGRAADPAGEAGFVSALAGGQTVEQVKAIILGSTEYYQRAGATVAGFLQSVYHDILSRALDPAGQSSWTAMLANTGRAAVAALILASPEAQTDLIQSAYQQYLHRPADPAGLAHWLAALQQATPDQTLTADILGSDEFFAAM
jgi:hypothetical protein